MDLSSASGFQTQYVGGWRVFYQRYPLISKPLAYFHTAILELSLMSLDQVFSTRLTTLAGIGT